MCIIMLKPPKQTITRRHLRKAFDVNSNGAGFMYDTEGKVVIDKGYFGFRKFYKSLRDAERIYPNSTFVIHMRISTSGADNWINCHPFLLNQGYGFVHNGVLSGMGDMLRSDTREFVEDVLNKLPNNFGDNPEIVKAINDYAIESHSKFVLLFTDGAFTIFNECLGHWRNGCWFSNESYNIVNYTKHIMGERSSAKEFGIMPWKDSGEIVSIQTGTETVQTRSASTSTGSQETSTEKTHKGLLTPQDYTCYICNKEPMLYIRINGLVLCDECCESMVGHICLRCDECGLRTPVTYELMTSNEQTCVYCQATLTLDHLYEALQELVN